MQNKQDFSNYNSSIIGELSPNREGRRISYLGECLTTQQKMIIKQFLFWILMQVGVIIKQIKEKLLS